MRRHAAGLAITSVLLACTVEPAPLLPWGKHHLSGTPLYPFTIDGKTGFIDRSGRVVIQPRLGPTASWLDYFEGVLVHRQELFDARGRQIRYGKWKLAGERSAEGFIRIRLPNGKMSHLQWKRNSVLPGQFDQAEDFSDGLAAVRVGGKWGFIDRTGRVVIAPRFIRADRFWNGMARVIETGPCWIDPGACLEKIVIGASEDWYRQDGQRHPDQPIDPKVPACRHIMIDRTGAYVRDAEPGRAPGPSQPEYSEGVTLLDRAFDAASPFRQGLALVRQGSTYHYIDRQGRNVFSFPASDSPR